MGSKGSATQTTQNVNQSYTADPRTQQAATQALQGAEAAAAQPFQMPVAPVAGFSNDQQTAFGQYQNLAGPNSPLGTAMQYANKAGTPLTQNDINQYYNPAVDSVTKQLQNIYGEQNSQNQGMLTSKAGGVGADRIAVGMGDLANQQTLGAGQVYSNLYQQAVQTAEQMKQMQAGAAGQFGQFEQGALGATGALNAAGTQQQQQTQQQLNAPYQNILARIAYQFQTPQYLAGIAGGLAPALGGSTYGNQITTPPQPSTLSQVLGIGTAGAGLYGAFGGFGGSGSNPAYGADGIYGGSGSNPLPSLSPSDYGQGYAKGGEVEGFDDGGAPDPMLQFPGVSVPKIGNPEAIPTSALPMGGGHSGMLGGQGIQFAQPQQQSNNSNNIGSDIASALKIATLFAKRGGGIPHYDGGGNLPGPDADPSRPLDGPIPNVGPWPFNSAHSVTGGHGEMVPDAPLLPPVDHNTPAIRPGSLLDKGINYFKGLGTASASSPTLPPFTKQPGIPYPGVGDIIPTPVTHPQQLEKRMEKKGKTGGGGGASTASAPAETGFTSPYPDALNRDWGQNATRSPWMALVNAGATMAATPGPLGVSIGKGLLAGTASLDKQRTELRSEQELNDKAQQLYDTAQQHLMKYNKMTAYERAEIGLENRKLDQGESDGTGVIKPMTEFQRANLLYKYKEMGKAYGWDDNRVLQEFTKHLQAARPGAGVAPAATAPVAGSSSETALPDPGEGNRKAGKWYIGPTGKPQQRLSDG